MRAGEDTVVNRELWRRGHGAFRAQDVLLIHHSRCTTPGGSSATTSRRGRGVGRIMLDDHAEGPPLLNRRALRRTGLKYVPDRLGRAAAASSAGAVRRSGGLPADAPADRRGDVAAWLGTWWEIVRPGRGKPRVVLRDTRVSR